jgi:hypothetical protein
MFASAGTPVTSFLEYPKASEISVALSDFPQQDCVEQPQPVFFEIAIFA